MIDHNAENNASKKKGPRRQLTAFLCREMLFDYATGRLDNERKQDVEAFLKQDASTRETLSSIRRGLDYSSELSQSQLTPEIFSRLSESENFRTVLSKATQWSRWPDSLRWSVTALTVSIITALLVAYIPWNKLPNFNAKKADGTVVLADIPSEPSTPGTNEVIPEEGAESDEGDVAASDTSGDEHAEHGEESPLPPGMVADATGYGDEGDIDALPPRPAVQDVQTIRAGKPAKGESPETPVAETPIEIKPVGPRLLPFIASVLELNRFNELPSPLLANIPPVPSPIIAIASAVKPQATPQAAVAAAPTPFTQPATKPVDVAATETDPTNETSEVASAADPGAAVAETKPTASKKPVGFVYRAFMNLADVQGVTPEITDKLIGFGAEKAGEVELGWRRGEGSYFHFTVPESNEAALEEMLRTYGPVRISKDPHPRVMPDGQIRIILWIEPATAQ